MAAPIKDQLSEIVTHDEWVAVIEEIREAHIHTLAALVEGRENAYDLLIGSAQLARIESVERASRSSDLATAKAREIGNNLATRFTIDAVNILFPKGGPFDDQGNPR